MLLAQLSDAVWLGIIGAAVMLIKEYFDRERAKAAALKAEADAKIISDKMAAEAKAITDKQETASRKSEADAKLINEKQDANHKLLNSELIEMKRIITDKAHAEGVLEGKKEQKAETDALTVAGITPIAPVAPGNGPATNVKIVDTIKDVPVEIKKGAIDKIVEGVKEENKSG